MKRFIVLGASILVLAFVGYGYGVPPGQPFQELLDLINSLAARITALEAGGGSGAQRIVFSGTIDLESAGDLVRTDDDSANNRRRVRHFKVFSISDLTTEDPPSVTLYERRRRDLAPFATSGFFVSGLANSFRSDSDITNLVVEDGQILLQFRVDVFNFTTGTPLPPSLYGLDGQGGTGDFRLVVIR